MAVSESICAELSAIFDAVTEAQCFVDALEIVQDEVRTGKSNPLVWSYRYQLDRLALACEALESTLRQKALPILSDFERATK